MEVPQKLKKLELAYDPEVPTPGIYAEKMKTNLKRHIHPNVHQTVSHFSRSVMSDCL